MKYSSEDTSTWLVEDNPSTKIIEKGPKSMTDTELIAAILSVGYFPTDETARQLFSWAGNSFRNLSTMSYHELSKVSGVGPKKASMILAAFELGARRDKEKMEDVSIKSSESIYHVMKPALGDLQHEEFWVVFLSRANKVIESIKISQGGLSGTVVDTRIILKHALNNLASAMILVHNHPSGNKTPSEADQRITDIISKASNTMDIKTLDHVIITSNDYYSFADEGKIKDF